MIGKLTSNKVPSSEPWVEASFVVNLVWLLAFCFKSTSFMSTFSGSEMWEDKLGMVETGGCRV